MRVCPKCGRTMTTTNNHEPECRPCERDVSLNEGLGRDMIAVLTRIAQALEGKR